MRSAEQQAADAELAARVETALALDTALYARHIQVDAQFGVVRLSGFVWSSDELYEARRAASIVPGAAAVVSELELLVGGRTGSR